MEGKRRKTLAEMAIEADEAAAAANQQGCGLTCPKCGCRNFSDLDGEKTLPVRRTNAAGPRNSIQRRRACRNCGNMFWTYERIAQPFHDG